LEKPKENGRGQKKHMYISSAAAAKSGASSCGVIYPNILRRLTDLAKSLQEDQSMQDGVSGHPIQSNPLMLN
jgi:hypothetical protein